MLPVTSRKASFLSLAQYFALEYCFQRQISETLKVQDISRLIDSTNFHITGEQTPSHYSKSLATLYYRLTSINPALKASAMPLLASASLVFFCRA